MEVVGALQSVFTWSAGGVESFWLNYFYLVDLREENQRLRQSLDRARSNINELREQGQANKRLISLLKFTDGHNYSSIGALVVGWDPGPWLKTITVDRGGRDGVEVGMPVISDQGVVGRIVEVSPNYSRVLLLVDYNSSIDAVVQRGRVRGIMTGRGEKDCIMEYVRKDEDVRIGDVVVTSGMSGAFPRGTLLGFIGGIKSIGYENFLSISVTPAVDFKRLEEVLIVLSQPPPFETVGPSTWNLPVPATPEP
jgi:rod shape-determining protein MreC